MGFAAKGRNQFVQLVAARRRALGTRLDQTDIVAGDVGAGFRQGDSRGEPDPARGTGDERDFAGQGKRVGHGE